MSVRVFRMARWYKIVAAISCLLICAASGYYVAVGSNIFYRAGGIAGIVFGIAAFLDVLVSRIVLEDNAIRIISLVRTQSHERGDFESAKVDGGAVCLKRRDGGWLILPGTGHNALGVRNTVDAWIKNKRGQETNVS